MSVPAPESPHAITSPVIEVIERPDAEKVRQLADKLVEAIPIPPPDTPYLHIANPPSAAEENGSETAKATPPPEPLSGYIVLRSQFYAEIVAADRTRVLGGVMLAGQLPVANEWMRELEPDHILLVHG